MATDDEVAGSSKRLGLLLAMAMFVLVVDTSLMNVSISAVVRDLDTTVSGVQSAIALEDDAQVMSNTQLEELLADQPPGIRDEILRINTDARPRALQVALLIPLLAGLLGLFNSFRMMRLPDPAPSPAVEGVALG
jgi:hypothetical protein